METSAPQVGVGVLVFKDSKVLLGRRKGSHGAGYYGGTGGHLEHMESFEGCAHRETLEEAGIEIENVRLLSVTNFKDHAPKHYVDIGLAADWKCGDIETCEPDKCDGWAWYDIDHLPSPLFGVTHNYFEAFRGGKTYFDA